MRRIPQERRIRVDPKAGRSRRRKPRSPPPSHHLVSQRGFATKKTLDILVENIDDVFLETPGFARRVWRDQHVRESPEGGFAWQRLLVEAVEAPTRPSASAVRSAASSTTIPRATLTRSAPGFSAASAAPPMNRWVSGVNRQVEATMSASPSDARGRLGQGPHRRRRALALPCGAPRSHAYRRRGASLARRVPMRPSPMTTRVCRRAPARAGRGRRSCRAKANSRWLSRAR